MSLKPAIAIAPLAAILLACSEPAAVAATAPTHAEGDLSGNSRQLEPAASKAWASHEAFENGMAALNQTWTLRIEPARFCDFGGGDNIIDLQELTLPSQAIPPEMPEMRVQLAKAFTGTFEASMPDHPARFDFSRVPDFVDPKPALGRLDAMFGEVEAICARRDAAVGAALSQTYGDEVSAGEGRPSSARRDARLAQLQDSDLQAIAAVARRMKTEMEAHREAIRKPVLDAIGAAQAAGG
jgi:hypothetical protein